MPIINLDYFKSNRREFELIKSEGEWTGDFCEEIYLHLNGGKYYSVAFRYGYPSSLREVRPVRKEITAYE